MKKYLFLLCVFTSVIVIGCTENSSDIPENSKKFQSSIATKVINPNDTSVYISPKMAEIINMIDTSKVPIPIEILIPSIDNINKKLHTQSTIASSQDDGTCIKGYDSYSMLYNMVKTNISEEQMYHFDMTEGIHYVTCYAVTKRIRFSSSVTINGFYEHGDTIGINPDDLNDYGYSITVINPGHIFLLTTYIWFISNNGEFDNSYICPSIPEKIYSGKFHEVDFNTFLNNMTWRYDAF